MQNLFDFIYFILFLILVIVLGIFLKKIKKKYLNNVEKSEKFFLKSLRYFWLIYWLIIFVYNSKILPDENNASLFLLCIFFSVFMVMFLQQLRLIFSQQSSSLLEVGLLKRKVVFYKTIYILWSTLFLLSFSSQVVGYIAEIIIKTEYITIFHEVAFFVIGITGELIMRYGKRLRTK